MLGQSFDVSWTVTDQGSVRADAAWQDGVYVSSTPAFDPNTATFLTFADAPSALAAGGSYTSAAAVTLSSMPAGNYYLLFVADINNDQGKLNESVDNVASVPISVTGPDLTVAINSASASAVAGNKAKVAVDWTVTNNSSAAAADTWTDAVYLSKTPALDLSNYTSYWALQSFNEPLVGPLAAGASYTQDRTVTIPNVASAGGTYYLIVIANQGESQPVTSTAGTTASTPISLTLPAVNLVVTQVASPPSGVVAGGSYTINYTVQNQGGDPANEAQWTDVIYLSNTTSVNSSAIEVGAYSFYSSTSLAAGSSYSGSASISIPGTAAAGGQYLLIEPDQSQTQAESNTNNVHPLAVTVTVPDVKLATTITSSPDSAAIGSSFLVSWQVTNNGTAATDNSFWYDQVYLSTSPTYSSAAINLSEEYVGSPPLPLAPGASYSESENVTAYASEIAAPGTYYLLVRAQRLQYAVSDRLVVGRGQRADHDYRGRPSRASRRRSDSLRGYGPAQRGGRAVGFRLLQGPEPRNGRHDNLLGRRRLSFQHAHDQQLLRVH